MFVSRDPNWPTPEECESKGKQWPGTISRSKLPVNRGISDGVIRALVGDPIGESLEKSIRGQVEALPIYWTHLVKCYACNNSTYLQKAAKTCVELLEQEIDYLDPELIIGFGNDVQSGLSEVGKLTRKMKEYEWLERLDELAKGDLVILPHPSGKDRIYIYQWEKRDITEAVKVIGRNLKDYELGHTFSLQPLKDRITELLHP